MKKPTPDGFTLIELMVVITIIALLSVSLIGPINNVLLAAKKTADTANLHWHYSVLRSYELRHKRLPTQGGHKFVLAPWISGTVEHTEANRDRYFSKALDSDAHVLDLMDKSEDDIWKDFDSVSSLDTHFAGRAREGRRHMNSGREIWMATDNEGGNTYRDGSVLLLFGDNTVKEIRRDPDQIKLGAPADIDVEYTLEVGPNSPHPDLRKLRK